MKVLILCNTLFKCHYALTRIYECAQVSLMTRIVPSPDWFIGVDGFDLCNDGKWIDTVTLEASQIITFVDHYAPMFQLCTRERADQPQCIILAAALLFESIIIAAACVCKLDIYKPVIFTLHAKWIQAPDIF